jgi:voltage-gated potassium channel Kch
MKIPFVKEWGSWAVFSSSCLAGLIAGLKTQPWLSGRDFTDLTVLTVLGLSFLINAKNPLASALRSKGKKEHVRWFLFFTLTGLALLIPFLTEGIKAFQFFALLVVSYIVLLYSGKEHHLAAELNGFALLTVSAPVVYFAVTGEMSWKLYLAVTVFFSAGVFKVRLRLRKSLLFRLVMILYCIMSAALFYYMNISLLILLPFLDNIMTALWLREEKLSTTGYIELTKGIVFLILIGLFWN